MDLPPEVLPNSIKDFCILFFKDVKHAQEAPPHFYVTFPIKDDLNLIICVISFQIESRERHYKRTNPKGIKSLVPIDNSIFSFLDRNKESIIDGNQSEFLSKEELKKRIDPKGPCEVKEGKIPSYLKRGV
jgi:hypothetical protein